MRDKSSWTLSDAESVSEDEKVHLCIYADSTLKQLEINGKIDAI